MVAKDVYLQWLQGEFLTEAEKAELKAIAQDSQEIEERFYKGLSFGTAGLRGILGVGTNRMNTYVVRRATLGLANYIVSLGEEAKAQGVVIAFDNRRFSPEFAQEAASVLAGQGIKVYLYEKLRPVPQLSFSVRHFKAIAGIMVTASHNPAQYNGYKVFWQDGAQIANEQADAITKAIEAITAYDLPSYDLAKAKEQGLIVHPGIHVDQAYYDIIFKQSLYSKEIAEIAADYPLVYTPLHGTGEIPVSTMLQRLGFNNIHLVKEQAEPDSEFPTVVSPNPEDPRAFDLALDLAKQVKAKLILATDPDSDRVGVMIPDRNGEYLLLTGNQTGFLLTYYFLNGLKDLNRLPENGLLITTIVTANLGAEIAASLNVKNIKTLTGFKYMGEKIKEFESTKEYEFLLGYEESYGYLVGTHARDKDGVVTAMLVAEMAAFYESQGMSLYDLLYKIYEDYGYYLDETKSLTLEGIEGLAKIKKAMVDLRAELPVEFAGVKVERIEDILEGQVYVNVSSLQKTDDKIDLPNENVLKFFLENEAWIAVRPSGTEPKLKIYIGVKEKSEEKAELLLKSLMQDALVKIEASF
ncbi:MAG: phospho-sugar mutase [Firmicutes bacterium]|jgi:phosphoglucomutase|nr:phospho-sugar mutase [Bacillota bacterium]